MYKISATVLTLLFSFQTFAVTWVVETQNLETMEVKTFKYQTTDVYKIESPNVKGVKCSLDIGKLVMTKPDASEYMQKATLLCRHGDSTSITNKICTDVPTAEDRALPLHVQITSGMNEADKLMKKGKDPGKFESTSIKVMCQP